MPAPSAYRVTADAIITREKGGQTEVVLITRKNPPDQGKHALPGGFLDPDETVERCCAREALEETSLVVKIDRLVGVYSDPARDPRGRTVSVAFTCTVKGGEVAAGDDAASANWVLASTITPGKMAFDHWQMLVDAGLARDSD